MKLFFATLASVLLIALQSPAHAAQESCPSSVVLYYAPYCPHSQNVLTYIKDNKVKMMSKDVSTDPVAKEELRTKGGLMQVPCLIIDGKPLYDDQEIIRWIKENQSCPGLSMQEDRPGASLVA